MRKGESIKTCKKRGLSEFFVLPLYLQLQIETNILNNMENKSKKIEEIFKQDLSMYLAGRQRVDNQLPDAPDIEEQWAKIGESYLPDAMREFSKYPTVALGWIMFVGMAIAKYWDEDWELYGKVDNLYEYLRDRIDFDHMDDYILDQVLLLDENEHKATSTIVAECAARTYTLLIHQGYEPGTEAAFRGFIAALHQMYLMGAAMELKRLGYHMTQLQ